MRRREFDKTECASLGTNYDVLPKRRLKREWLSETSVKSKAGADELWPMLGLAKKTMLSRHPLTQCIFKIYTLAPLEVNFLLLHSECNKLHTPTPHAYDSLEHLS